jgi:hypothetical protein
MMAQASTICYVGRDASQGLVLAGRRTALGG